MTSNAELQEVINNIPIPKIEEGSDNAAILEYMRQVEAVLSNWPKASRECECMVCDLPLEVKHEKVQWSVTVWFPGPYPKAGETEMLLCDHCKNDWVDGEWDEVNGNYIVVGVSKIEEGN
ncbi:MAG: hypothetical protein KF867_08395 [Cryobacterium sp.]|nr:hypothetical protein [Cryobacterium sp.]